ncbi:unnamed protein product [Didymodactylos carnosus]|uniref:medium-chain acyl-CoA ligase n=1 Tax=Didymodactylos carnosus TaxID=1234261 RepID=A0A813NBY5_9BILA|nr:unnamed protein product [Didymodactylos carnosus]CAF0737026.1 unnamed protein product [Didymodactylos carnosus]CAF3494867.1 unnamed protein product [Didymodactylos carnosus]CAF3515009.1 unnamed protein product [Didymodactylos carnosus]
MIARNTRLRSFTSFPNIITDSNRNTNNNRLTFKFNELLKTLASSNSEKFSNYLEKSLNLNYTHFNFVGDIIKNWSIELPTATALWSCEKDYEYKLTFKELLEYSSQFANALNGKYYNLRPGNTVIVLLPRVKEWYFIKLACLMSGLIFCPCTTQLTEKDIRYRILVSGADCIITDEENLEKVTLAVESSIRPIIRGIVNSQCSRTPYGWLNLSLDAASSSTNFNIIDSQASLPALRYFTSGTTGHPKIVQHSQLSVGLGHLTTSFWLTGEHDTNKPQLIWNNSDTGWAKSSYSSFFGPWLIGNGIFQKQMTRFDTETICETLEQYPIETFCSGATSYRMMSKYLLANRTKLKKFHSLKQCVSAGEALNPEVIKLWSEFTNIIIREGYGQTETTLLAGTTNTKDIKQSSIGKPMPTIDLKIVNKETLNVCDADVEGEIAIKMKPNRPIGLFHGYVNNKKRDGEVFIGDYYFTGDRAIMDKDGYIFYIGRSDDIINSSGYRIGPYEVESILLEHPIVVDCAVISSPDVERSEIVKAFVVLNENYLNKDKTDLIHQLQTYVKQQTAPYKYPRQIEFVNELPKTTNGKLKRHVLKSNEWIGVQRKISAIV